MSSAVRSAQSLCRHGGSSNGGFQEKSVEKEKVVRKKRLLRGARAVLLQGCSPTCRACLLMCSSCHTCCPIRQHSLAGWRALLRVQTQCGSLLKVVVAVSSEAKKR